MTLLQFVTYVIICLFSYFKRILSNSNCNWIKTKMFYVYR